MPRDLFKEAGITANGPAPRDLFKEAGIAPAQGVTDTAEQPNTFVDMLKAVPGGIGDAISGTLGLPVDMFNLSAAGRTSLGNKVLGDQSPEQLQVIRQRLTALKAQGHPFLQNIDIDAVLSQQEQPDPVPGGSQDINEALTNVIPALGLEAETRPGKIVQRGVDFGAAALTGAPFANIGLKTLALAGAASGVASEAAGQFAEGTDLEAAARIGGAIAGGGASTLRFPHPNQSTATQRAIRERTQNLTDDDFIRAQALQDAANQQGTPLLGPEALDSPPTQQLASATAQSPSGAPIITEALANRNRGIRDTVQRQADELSGAAVNPREVAQETQQVAEGTLAQVRKARTDRSSPFFEAAKDEAIDSKPVRKILRELNAMRTPRGHPLKGAIEDLKTQLTRVDGSPETNAGVLKEVSKLLNERVNINKATASPVEKAVAASLRPFDAKLRLAINEGSQSIKRGNEIFARLSREIVEPMERSGIGDLAKSSKFRQATRLLLSPDEASPRETFNTLRTLGQQAPELPGKIVKLHLENIFDRASKTTISGAPNTGVNFFKATFGTPKQQHLLRIAFSAVEQQRGLERGVLFNGFNKSMRILERMGKIPGAGSPTQTRQAIERELSKGGVLGRIADTLNITRGAILSVMSDFSASVSNRENQRQLADLFTDPNSVGLIRQIARSEGPTSRKAITALVTLLGAGRQQVNQSAKSDREQ